jgi:aminoglycoside/choline kinase family phosphotransferase
LDNPNADGVSWADDSRRTAFERWLTPLVAAHQLRPGTLRPASADASFRRYLRVDTSADSLIVMDAPPPQEDVRPFVKIAGLIDAAGLNGPKVLAADEAQGFLLLTDLGNELYLHALTEANAAQADHLMRDAIAALVQWQLEVPGEALPPYDDAILRRELQLFPDWCVEREYGVSWSPAEHKT